ncbi:MAG TPA: hypothetical protein VF112_05750 [Candidatus Dormibacteraeota bacterium]
MRAAGFPTVRVHLGWDSFMPSHRGVSRHRLAELETLLDTARGLSLGVVPVLFVQSFGDCVMLPRYMVDRAAPRPGVRVVSDGNVEPGGPRDAYADPLMQEAAVVWLEALLDAFANHPAVVAWDIGHDPASTIRPRRIAQLVAWVELIAERVHARGDLCRLTLGAGDVLVARAVRPALLAPHLDALGLAVPPQHLGLGEPLDPGPTVFLTQLALRLAAPGGGAPPLTVVTGVAAGAPDEAPPAPPAPPTRRRHPEPVEDTVTVAEDVAARHAGDLLSRLGEVGVSGLEATAWCDLAGRVVEAAPYDRRPWLGRHGLLRSDGETKAGGEVWAAAARREQAVVTAEPWPGRLDPEGYYAARPDSARDLLSEWRREREGAGAEPSGGREGSG